MNHIDWSQAPEWATSVGTLSSNKYWMNDDSYEPFNGNKRIFFTNYDSTDYECFVPIATRPKPESIPVYTQSMADAEELPSVGMEFISTEFVEERHSIVKAITNDYIIYVCADPKHTSECCIEICANHHKPIDTRTDEQKCVDNMMYAYRKGESMADVLSEIKKGYIHGVTWSKQK